MIIEDKANIKSLKFKYPELMSEDANSIVFNTLNKEVKLKNKIWELRQEITKLEEELKYIQILKQDIENIYIVEYNNKEVKEVKDECNILVSNKDDYRNK